MSIVWRAPVGFRDQNLCLPKTSSIQPGVTFHHLQVNIGLSLAILVAFTVSNTSMHGAYRYSWGKGKLKGNKQLLSGWNFDNCRNSVATMCLTVLSVHIFAWHCTCMEKVKLLVSCVVFWCTFNTGVYINCLKHMFR